METNQTEPQIEQRLPWHKPEVNCLTVTLDTGQGGGSPVDGAAQSDTGLQGAYEV